MPRASASGIRIRKSDVERIKKLNASARRKQRRLKNEFGVEINIDIKKVNDFSTREQFNNYVQSLENFTYRNRYRYVKNEYGVVISRKQYNEIRKETERINKIYEQRRKRLDKMPFTSRGKKTYETVKDRRLMGDVRFNEFRKRTFRFEKFRNKSELNAFVNNLSIKLKPDYFSKKDILYKQNYIKALQNVYGTLADDIIEIVEKMNTSQFIDIFYSEDIGEIGFHYDDVEMRLKLEATRSFWYNYQE